MNHFSLKSSLIASFFLSGLTLLGDQIERETIERFKSPPSGVLVKADPLTKVVEVFKAPAIRQSIKNKTASADEIAVEIRTIETSANKIAEFKVIKGELDRDSSTESCWYGSDWSWNGWGGYTPYSYNYYQPYSYPGSFNYGCNNSYAYAYAYAYSYNYNNANYGWYY